MARASVWGRGVMQPQNFNIITAYAVDRDGVLVQNQLAGTGHPACSAHAGMGLQLGDTGAKFNHNSLLGSEATRSTLKGW